MSMSHSCAQFISNPCHLGEKRSFVLLLKHIQYSAWASSVDGIRLGFSAERRKVSLTFPWVFNAAVSPRAGASCGSITNQVHPKCWHSYNKNMLIPQICLQIRQQINATPHQNITTPNPWIGKSYLEGLSCVDTIRNTTSSILASWF